MEFVLQKQETFSCKKSTKSKTGGKKYGKTL